MFNVVVLPQPDGPRKTTNLPLSNSRLVSSTAVSEPNTFRNPSSLIVVMRNPGLANQ
jgi:hypothetical protein